MQPVKPQGIEHPEVKHRQIIDTGDPVRQREPSKAWMCGSIDAKVLGEGRVMHEPAGIALSTMEQQQRRTFSSTVEMHVGPSDGHRRFLPGQVRHTRLLGLVLRLEAVRGALGACYGF